MNAIKRSHFEYFIQEVSGYSLICDTGHGEMISVGKGNSGLVEEK